MHPCKNDVIHSFLFYTSKTNKDDWLSSFTDGKDDDNIDDARCFVCVFEIKVHLLFYSSDFTKIGVVF